MIIYCTGYDIKFPFFDPSLLDVVDNEVQLFERVIHPEMNNLFFLGLVQPLCAIMPIAEVQAKWLATLLTGDYALPPARADSPPHPRGVSPCAQGLLEERAPHDPGA